MNNYFIVDVFNYNIEIISAPDYLDIDNIILLLNSSFKNCSVLHVIENTNINSTNIKLLHNYLFYDNFYYYFKFQPNPKHPQPYRYAFKYLTDEIADYLLTNWSTTYPVFRSDFEKNYKIYRNRAHIENIIK